MIALTVNEYAKLTGLHPVTVRELCRTKRIKATRPTKREQGRWKIWEQPEPTK